MKHLEEAMKKLKKIKSKGIDADPELVEDKPLIPLDHRPPWKRKQYRREHPEKGKK